MSDFKWQMQERIDQGMSPDAAYNDTRDSYAAAYDNRDKTKPQPRPEYDRDVYDHERQTGQHDDAFVCGPDDIDESGGVA